MDNREKRPAAGPSAAELLAIPGWEGRLTTHELTTHDLVSPVPGILSRPVTEDHNHSEDFWRQRLPVALPFLFPPG